MVSKSRGDIVMEGSGDDIGNAFSTDVQIGPLIVRIFSVKGLAYSLQTLLEFSSGPTVTTGLISLSTVANNPAYY